MRLIEFKIPKMESGGVDVFIRLNDIDDIIHIEEQILKQSIASFLNEITTLKEVHKIPLRFTTWRLVDIVISLIKMPSNRNLECVTETFTGDSKRVVYSAMDILEFEESLKQFAWDGGFNALRDYVYKIFYDIYRQYIPEETPNE